MPATQFAKVVRHIHHMAAGTKLSERTDFELLEAFSRSRDQHAFTALVTRHGPLVYRICRRLLNHEQDAEDAFQAVFLILACNGRSIRKHEALAGWLHGVAYRTAMKAKRTAARRRNHETAVPAKSETTSSAHSWDDVQTVLDEEIQLLPKTYRSAFVLCIIEGKTGPQAARELGIPPGTVSSRVTSARKRLKAKLSRRGIELSAVLAALSVAGGASQAVPAHLLQTQLLADLCATALGTATGSLPKQVTTLAAAMSRTLFLSNAKVVTGIFLASLVIVGGGVWARQSWAESAAAHSDQPPARTSQTQPRPEPVAQKSHEEGVAVYRGQVVDPNGKPVANARVYVLYYTPKELPVPLRAKTDSEGRFKFEVPKKSFDTTYSTQPWNEAMLVARADGYGLALSERGLVGEIASLAARSSLGEVTLRLAPDTIPVQGRVLDTEGKPTRNTTVRLGELHSNRKGNLDGFLHEAKATQLFYPSLRKHLQGFEGWIARDLGKIFNPVKTDADGRFIIHGIGDERLVRLEISGPIVTTTNVYALTRKAQSFKVQNTWNTGMEEEPTVVHGASFDLVLAPSRPVVGVVRDKETGAPISGAVVQGSHPPRTKFGFGISKINVSTTSDARGRYELTGLPKGPGNVITVSASQNEPFLSAQKQVADRQGLEAIDLDFTLQRGIWLDIHVFDKATGKPVVAQVEYGVFEDNPQANDFRALTFERDSQTSASAGTVRMVGVPGRGLVGARTFDNRYPRLEGSDIKPAPQNGMFQTLPTRMSIANFSALAEVDPALDASSIKVDLAVEQGKQLTGIVVGPDGKPVAGVLANGLNGFRSWEYQPLSTPSFSVKSLRPGKPWLLQFAHPEKKLAGHVFLKGNEKGPIKAQLGLAGTIRGRVVTKDGDPVTNGTLIGMSGTKTRAGQLPSEMETGSLPPAIHLDKDGRFVIEGLAPNLTYKLALLRSQVYLTELEGKAAETLTVKPGETIDLGDVVVKLLDN
jgi:RNA polymerase sigma factor (sigma-70 family)